jgi:threonine dehydrogenase-like Zn-dependent dehydrogenase
MKPGQNVAVFGAGPVGIMIVMVVRRAGGGHCPNDGSPWLLCGL